MGMPKVSLSYFDFKEETKYQLAGACRIQLIRDNARGIRSHLVTPLRCGLRSHASVRSNCEYCVCQADGEASEPRGARVPPRAFDFHLYGAGLPGRRSFRVG